MTQEDKFAEIKALSELASNNWDDIRNPSSYDYRNVNYRFGVRRVATPSERTNLLQASRGQTYDSNIKKYEDFLDQYKKDSEILHDFDKYRILEVVNLHNSGVIQLKNDMKFYEFGFRSTSVLQYWQTIFSKVSGCDVVKPCVNAAQDLGFNVEYNDLNHGIPNINDVGLLSAYHVFEHLSDPLACLEKVYSSLSSGAVLHIEVPIEPDGPRIRYGHLFPFHPGDLKEMLSIAGFRIVHYEDKSFPGGPPIERAVAVKD